MASIKQIPVTLVLGLPGSGKSSLVDHLRANAHNLKLGVITHRREPHADPHQNQLQQIRPIRTETIEADTAKRHPPSSPGMVFSGDDLELVATDLLSKEGADLLVVEAGGFSDARTLIDTLDSGSRPREAPFKLDTIVAVVDAERLLSDWHSTDEVATREQGSADLRGINDLLIDQLECANVILINKCDRLDRNDYRELRSVLYALNPQAVTLEVEYGRCPVSSVLNTHQFDRTQNEARSGWKMALRGERVFPQEYTQCSSFVFTDPRPFHPERLSNFLQDPLWRGIIRSHGTIWLASRPDYAARWSQGGASCRFEPGDAWEVVGKPQQHFAVLTQGVTEAEFSDAAQHALLSDQELHAGSDAWLQYADPFPDWIIGEDSDLD